MTAGLSEIRAAVKTVLADAGLGLEILDVMPLAVHSDTIGVLPKSWSYDETFDAGCLWELEIWLYITWTDDLEEKQRVWDQYMAPSGALSIAAALHDEPSLLLAGVNLRVSGAPQYAQFMDMGGAKCLGGYLRCEVFS